ncbi:5-formyltetrahydrofolate cyclo-ligase [Herbaspirillum rhizosphaerae]|uniref:5-formyltetrahydrofolate cyclo-ligase n=1 Tax=Herbaspirillum rhizosphaerae TaxID=346179 RepID=UPI00067BD51C|nr:5-formyltetrahydrofolate cyclo-ligase [Herbaspirillum rhizosphaerae]
MTTSRIARDTTPSDTAETTTKTALPAADKSALRTRLLAARKAMTPAARAAAEASICTRLLAWLQTQQITSIGVYHPIRQEPDLHPVYNALSVQGVHLSLPIIRGKELPLEFVRWTPGEMLVKDAMGTSVPAQGAIVQPQALLIPCLGFNAAKLRLGYGGGFYDRTLAQTPRPLAIGIAYADALVEFDGQAHDIALDLIIADA